MVLVGTERANITVLIRSLYTHRTDMQDLYTSNDVPFWTELLFICIDLNMPWIVLSSKIEKVPRGIRGEKSSKDMASSRKMVSTIGELASPKMGDGTRCPEG